MNEPFILPVNYQGTEHEFKERFERWGYTHRISVLIERPLSFSNRMKKVVTVY
jgi:hypothetical protein